MVMNTRILAALRHLNAVYAAHEMGRQYGVRQCGDLYMLVSPLGAEYPKSDANETVKRIVRLEIAAQGRLAR